MMNGATKCCAVVVLSVLLGFIGSALVSSVLAFLGNSGVMPPHARPHRLTYADWSVRWWQWADSIPAVDNPILDQTGDDCGQSQSGSVWFLAGTAGGSVARSCTVLVGKAILFPIITINNDFPLS
jgi:hypothetical protein